MYVMLMRPSRTSADELLYSTKYGVARVVTTMTRAPSGARTFRSVIRFEGADYAAVETHNKRDAGEAHDDLGAYCLGMDQRVQDPVSRARAAALVEIRAMFEGSESPAPDRTARRTRGRSTRTGVDRPGTPLLVFPTKRDHI